MLNIKYCFISHNRVVQEDYDRIKTMMESLKYNNYYIIYGGKRHIENDHVVHIDCDDAYCGLPEKINKTMKYLALDNDIDYVFKTDRTCMVKKIFDEEKIKNFDYYGKVFQFKGKSVYHNNKCEKSSHWYKKTFTGKKIPFCGGAGYLLSKKCISIIAKNNDYIKYALEDYYVGLVLSKHKIIPMRINTKDYFYDPEHKDFM